MSSCTAPRCGADLGSSAFADAEGPPAPARSEKLVLPLLSWARSTLSPERVTRSTTTCSDSKGSSASDTLATSMRAKVLSLLRSDSEVLSTATPMLGKNDSPIFPSMASVRPVFSLTTRESSDLYLLGSKVAKTTAIAAATSTTTPPTARNTYLITFMRAHYALATPI